MKKPLRTEIVIARVTAEQKQRIAEITQDLDISEAQFVRQAIRVALEPRKAA